MCVTNCVTQRVTENTHVGSNTSTASRSRLASPLVDLCRPAQRVSLSLSSLSRLPPRPLPRARALSLGPGRALSPSVSRALCLAFHRLTMGRTSRPCTNCSRIVCSLPFLWHHAETPACTHALTEYVGARTHIEALSATLQVREGETHREDEAAWRTGPW
jgi:hypothetical protein